MKPGCQKLLIGCIAVPCILILLFAVCVLVFRLQGAPEHRTETAHLEQPLAPPTPGQMAAEGLQPGTKATAEGVLAVRITLSEGNFHIKPGPPGSSIKVEGEYDAGSYDLIQHSDSSDPARPTYELNFKPKYSWLRRMFTEGGVHMDDNANPIVVWLPAGVPMDLTAQVSVGKSDIDLTGLSLNGLSLDMSMGEHDLTVSQPNALEIADATLRGRMGEIKMHGLGNLRASSIDIWGRMGEMRLDVGPITKDTKITSHFRMGSLRLSVPQNVRTKASSSIFLGDARGMQDDPNAPNSGPLLEIQSQTTMGDITVTRY